MKRKRVVFSILFAICIIGIIGGVFLSTMSKTQAITRGEMIENNSGTNYTAIDNVVVVGDSNEGFMSAYYLNGGKDGGLDTNETGDGAGNWYSGQSHTSAEDLNKYYNYVDDDGDGWICQSGSGLVSGNAFTNWEKDILNMLKTESANGKRTALIIHVSVNDYYTWENEGEQDIATRYYTEYKKWVNKNKETWEKAGATAILIAPMTPYPASDGYEKWDQDLENNYNPKIRQLARECGIDYYDDYTYLSQCLGDNYTDNFGPDTIGSGKHYNPQAYQIMMRCLKLVKHSNTLPRVTIDKVTSCTVSNGLYAVTVRGWAFDPDDSDKSLKLEIRIGDDIYTKDINNSTLIANQSSDDVNEVFNIRGAHRFIYTVNTTLTGTQVIYVGAHDSNFPEAQLSEAKIALMIQKNDTDTETDNKSTCSISYDATGGSGTMEPSVVEINGQISVPECKFLKDNHSFMEWNTKSDGTGTAYAVGTEITVTEDMTLYAQWKSNDANETNQNVPSTSEPSNESTVITVNVQFDANGGTGTMDTISAESNSNIILPECKFQKTGNQFISWNTAKDGTGETYFPGDTMKAINCVLYARWSLNATTTTEKETRTVIYNSNGGTGTIENGEYTVPGGTLKVAKNNFKRDGYTFICWNSAADGTGTFYDADTTSDTINGTVYAQWDTTHYAVITVANGSTENLTLTDYSAESKPTIKLENDDIAKVTINQQTGELTITGKKVGFTKMTIHQEAYDSYTAIDTEYTLYISGSATPIKVAYASDLATLKGTLQTRISDLKESLPTTSKEINTTNNDAKNNVTEPNNNENNEQTITNANDSSKVSNGTVGKQSADAESQTKLTQTGDITAIRVAIGLIFSIAMISAVFIIKRIKR